jgi:hypothetical protein
VAFIRRVPTASGATAVQIAQYVGGRQRIIKHVGSAHTEAELGVLMARARELLEDTAQGVLDLDVEPTLPVVRLVTAPSELALFEVGEAPAANVGRDGPGRVVGTDCRVLFEALAAVYAELGFRRRGRRGVPRPGDRSGGGADLAARHGPGADRVGVERRSG